MKKHLFILLIIFSFNSIQAQVSWNMELLSMVDDNTIPDNGNNQWAYNEIWGYAENNREYAIVGSAAYIHFFDVTDPTNPILVDQFAGGDTTIWRDIKTFENYAYTISDETSEGMMIFDLSDLPNSVSLVSQSNTFFTKAHNIFIDTPNEKMYVAGSDVVNNGLIVLDIGTNPTSPELIGNDTLIDYVHDVYVRDNIAYCSHGNTGFAVWDYTDATEPILKASLSTNGYNHSSWVSDDGTFAIFAEEVPPGLPMGTVDLTNVDNGFMEILSYFQFPLITDDDIFNTPHNPFILGNYAFVSYYEDGVQVLDLTDPANPVLLGYFDTFPNNNNYQGYFGCWGVYPYLPSGNIIATDRKYGLHVMRFNDPNLVSVEDEFSEKDIAIFPNPSLDGVFNILNNKIEGQKTLLEVIDVSGKLVFQKQLSNTSEQINLSDLPNGFYFGKIKIGEKEVVKKLMVSK